MLENVRQRVISHFWRPDHLMRFAAVPSQTPSLLTSGSGSPMTVLLVVECCCSISKERNERTLWNDRVPTHVTNSVVQ